MERPVGKDAVEWQQLVGHVVTRAPCLEGSLFWDLGRQTRSSQLFLVVESSEELALWDDVQMPCSSYNTKCVDVKFGRRSQRKPINNETTSPKTSFRPKLLNIMRQAISSDKYY